MSSIFLEGGGLLYKKFKFLLNKRNVTAYQVGKATGVATSTLTEWKKGTYTPKVDKLKKIADYFGVTLEYLLDESEVQT